MDLMAFIESIPENIDVEQVADICWNVFDSGDWFGCAVAIEKGMVLSLTRCGSAV